MPWEREQIRVAAQVFAILVFTQAACSAHVPSPGKAVARHQLAMNRMSDEAVILALQSHDADEASEAVREVMQRGERLIPLLARCKGNRGAFYGSGLGHQGAAVLLPELQHGESSDPERTVSVEAAALYLISAIYYDRLDFAQSPYLVDLNQPAEKRQMRNKKRLVRRAWQSVEQWMTLLRHEGLESLRQKQIPPLYMSHTAFW